MLGAAEPPLRRGFACGKTLVRRTRAAGQKAGWWFFCNGPFHKKGICKADAFFVDYAAHLRAESRR